MDEILKEIDEGKPLIIFIDELDRCRPLYAIECLERIKHIFGIKQESHLIITELTEQQSPLIITELTEQQSPTNTNFILGLTPYSTALEVSTLTITLQM
jgi:predicted KAP-like P-loop ATPase